MTGLAFLTLKEAAAKLRKSERWLWDWLDKTPRDPFDRPYYRLAGRTKLLSEGDVARIFEALPCPSSSGRRVPAKRRTSKSEAPTSESAWKLLAELTNDHSLASSSGRSKSASKRTDATRPRKLSLIQGGRPS